MELNNKFLGILMILGGVLLLLFSFKLIFKILILSFALLLIIYGSKLAGYSDWHFKVYQFFKSKRVN